MNLDRYVDALEISARRGNQKARAAETSKCGATARLRAGRCGPCPTAGPGTYGLPMNRDSGLRFRQPSEEHGDGIARYLTSK